MSSVYTTSYSNPEQVLKAAEEFQNLGKETAALDSLYSFMTNTRNKQWSQALENIMLLLIRLSLENKRGQSLSEPLKNYKTATQHVNIGSLEKVLGDYCASAETILDQTAKKHDYRKLLDDEDLEEGNNTELYVNSVSTDNRSEKEELRSAWRLVWDTYKTVLDCISRNKKLEELYQRVALKAFEFCKKYNRRNEVKRLFESLRSNLIGIIKTMERNPDFQKIPFVVDLADPDTNEIQLNIRLSQLQYAYHFKLWQEALRTLEDINNIMQKRKSPTKPKILSEYFENLAKMFWKSDFYLYHAYAFFLHFNLIKSRSRLSSEELKIKSSYLILAILSIPPIQNEQDQSDDSRSKAMSLLTSSGTIPKKQELLNYVLRQNLIDLCIPEVRELFLIMEHSNDVVSLAKNVEAILKKLEGENNKELAIFNTQIQNVVVYKVLIALSKIYKTIKIDKLKKFIGFIPYRVAEKILHYAAISHHINIRIDHSKGLITFRGGRQDLQNMSMKISSISEEIQEVVSKIESKLNEANENTYRQQLRTEAQSFVEHSGVELNARRKIVSDLRKGEKVRMVQEEQQSKVERANEEARLAIQLKENEKKEQDIGKRRDILNKLNIVDIQKRTRLAHELKGIKTVKINGKKISEYTEDELVEMTADVLEEAKAELTKEQSSKEEAKLKTLFKKIDFLERAKRQEAAPLLRETWKGSEEEKKELLDKHKEAFEKNQEIRKSLLHVQKLKEEETGKLLEERKRAYEQQIKAFKELVAAEFKEKIISQAKAAIEQKKRDIEEAEIRMREELIKQKKEVEQRARENKTEESTGLMSRSTLARSTPVENKAFPTATTTNTTSSSSGLGMSRSTMARDTAPKEPTGGMARNPEPAGGISRASGTAGASTGLGGSAPFGRKEETKKDDDNKFVKGTGQAPRFITSKKAEPVEQISKAGTTTTTGATGGFSRSTGTANAGQEQGPVKRFIGGGSTGTGAGAGTGAGTGAGAGAGAGAGTTTGAGAGAGTTNTTEKKDERRTFGNTERTFGNTERTFGNTERTFGTTEKKEEGKRGFGGSGTNNSTSTTSGSTGGSFMRRGDGWNTVAK